jgi:hypothetical protein
MITNNPIINVRTKNKMTNSSNKQTNPVLAGCLSLMVLAVMIGGVSTLRSRETATKSSNIVVSRKVLQVAKVSEVSNISKLPGTTPTPLSTQVPATIPTLTPPVPTSPSPKLTPQPVPSPTPKPTLIPPAPRYIYKNGTYAAVGTFTAPGVIDHLKVSITLLQMMQSLTRQ